MSEEKAKVVLTITEQSSSLLFFAVSNHVDILQDYTKDSKQKQPVLSPSTKPLLD